MSPNPTILKRKSQVLSSKSYTLSDDNIEMIFDSAIKHQVLFFSNPRP